MSPISQPNPATHTRSKLIESFHVSGFIYYDGALVFDQLAIGKKLTLRREPDNHYDANAIALYYGVHKLGFVPRDSNHTIAKVMDAGYDLFEGGGATDRPNSAPRATNPRWHIHYSSRRVNTRLKKELQT